MLLSRRSTILAALLVSMPFLAANAAEQPDWIKGPLKKPMDQVVVGIASIGAGVNAYAATYMDTFKKYADELGVKAVMLDSRMDPQTQSNQIDGLVAQNVDALIIWPVNADTVIPAIKRANAASVPVLITNTPLPPSDDKYIAAYSGPNSYDQAKAAGELMVEALGGKGNVVMINGTPGYAAAEQRVAGFMDVIKKYPDIKVLASEPSNWSQEKSQSLMESYITRFGDQIDGVYAADGGSGTGALNAVNSAIGAGRLKADHIKFTDCNAFASTYDVIKKDPNYYGTTWQSPIEDAKLALKTAILVAQGKEVPKVVKLDTPKITRANIDQFERPTW